MLIRLDASGTEAVTFTFDGHQISARQGDTVAAALLATDRWVFRRTIDTDTARGPYCMMGACFECLVRIDGKANQQACMTEVTSGMTVRTQGRKP